MKFIVMGLPKTGKTMLVHTLNRIDGFRVLGEIFNTRDRSPKMPTHPLQLMEDIRLRDQKNNLHTWYCKRFSVKKFDITEDVLNGNTYEIIDDFLNEMIFLPDLHCGFKLHHHHIELTPILKDWILDNEDIHIIHCNRINKIKEAIAAIGNRARGQKFHADPESTELLMLDNLKRYYDLKNWFSEETHYLEVFYEELTNDTDSDVIDLTPIRLFLGKDVPKTMNVLTRKNTKDKVSENLTNYDEFCEYFKRTHYEQWID